jgi:hypothetical protein
VGQKRVLRASFAPWGVARRKAREPCLRAAALDRVGTAWRGTAALAPLPTLRNCVSMTM